MAAAPSPNESAAGPGIGGAWEDSPLNIAGFEAKTNTHFPELFRLGAHGAGGGLTRAGRGGTDRRFVTPVLHETQAITFFG